MVKQVQDHLGDTFTFHDSKGRKHSLPPVTAGQDALSGRALRDAAVGGEAGQLAYMFRLLEAAKPKPETLDALYDMPQSEMLDILKAWGETGDGEGASLGE